MRRLVVLLAPVTVLGRAVSSCSGSQRSSRQGGPVHFATNGSFTMAITNFPGSFDVFHTNLKILNLASLSYDPLVNETARPTIRLRRGIDVGSRHHRVSE